MAYMAAVRDAHARWSPSADSTICVVSCSERFHTGTAFAGSLPRWQFALSGSSIVRPVLYSSRVSRVLNLFTWAAMVAVRMEFAMLRSGDQASPVAFPCRRDPYRPLDVECHHLRSG
jgi:hypothetical protein